MITINENYLKLEASYLFSDIAKRAAAFQKANPGKELIKLGIGDVTRPLPAACIKAFHGPSTKWPQAATFRGYGPEQGYDFLREKIAKHDFQARGADIAADEIFRERRRQVRQRQHPGGLCHGHHGGDPRPGLPGLPRHQCHGRAHRGFRKRPLQGGRLHGRHPCQRLHPGAARTDVDLIYLCFPNNPTGATIGKAQLKQWVDFARQRKAIILYDAAYEVFIRDPDLPHSIYEIEGATEVAIEFRSFSKMAGFTGTRCAYSVVPKACTAYTAAGEPQPVHALWHRRHTTKFNGVSYPVQRAAEAVYSTEGLAQCRELSDYYLRNAELIRSELSALGYECIGGENSPYIWVDSRMDSWKFFDLLLEKANVVCTPGVGFGRCGAGYIRVSAFNDYEKVQVAMERIRKAIKAA
jgi:LL-diaminopimelate aminotransferase